MSFDYIYKEEWESLGIKSLEVDDARILLRAIFTEDFLKNEESRSMKISTDIVTRNFKKHPLLTYLESPFLSNVCSLLHITESFREFYNSKSINEYIARMKKQELFDSALLELEFATFLKQLGLNVDPSYKVDNGEIDILIKKDSGINEIYIECKTYNYKNTNEDFEYRRNLLGHLMKQLKDLPTGFIVCFRSYVEITGDTYQMIKNKLSKLIKDAPNLYEKGENMQELFFGKLDIMYFEKITYEITRKIRSEYNEFISRDLMSEEYLRKNFNRMIDPENSDMSGKKYEGALAFDLPLITKEKIKINYLEKVKTDIANKIKQHQDSIHNSDKNLSVCIVLEDIPKKDFEELKQEVEKGLYYKYKTLSIVFVKKVRESKKIDFDIYPLKLEENFEKVLERYNKLSK
jgi:hypothetical protein